MQEAHTDDRPALPFPWLTHLPLETPGDARPPEQKRALPFGEALGFVAVSHDPLSTSGGIRTDTVKTGSKATVEGNKVKTDTVVNQVFDKVDPIDR